MRVCGVIPVRAGSSRFPEKGLAKLAGKEIILHVYERAKGYRKFERLIVATDDERIKALVENAGGEVFFSKVPYRNGSERSAAAIKNVDCEICVNIQGDEVFITPGVIEQTVKVLAMDPILAVATALFPITDPTDLDDPNLVKVIIDERNRAIMFSRIPINHYDGLKPTNYGHAGIYAYRKEFLMTYATLPPTAGELQESLEQLRILESGYAIGVAYLNEPLLSINTPDDLELAGKVLSREGGVRK